MSRRSKLLSRLAALAFALPGAAWCAETANENELKAAYLYRFAQFTTWPNPPAGGFNFCIQGNHPVEEELRKLQGKTVQNAPVSVQRVDSAEAATACHVLFLHIDRPKELAEWMVALRSRPVLADPTGQKHAMTLTMDRLGKGGEPPGLRAARSVLRVL